MRSEEFDGEGGGSFMPGPTPPKEVAREALRSSKKSIWDNPIAQWGYQFVLGGLVLLIAGYITLWSDNHNDGRYLKKEDDGKNWQQFLKLYEMQIENGKSDRNSIRAMTQTDKTDIDKKLDRQQVQLDTITADIKSLLRQPVR